MGGQARPDRPCAAVLSLRREGHQCIPQRLGLLRHRLDLAFAVLRFVGLQPLLDVRAAGLQQALDQTSEFVRRGRDGFGGPKPRLHTPQEGPQGTLGVVQTAGCQAQGDGDARRAGSHTPRQDLPTRELVLGTQPQPATEVFHAGPPVHVRTDLAEDDQGRAFFDPLDGRQVDAGQALERGAGIEPGFVGLRVSAGLGGQGLPSALVGKGLQMGFDLLIAVGDLLVGEFIQGESLA